MISRGSYPSSGAIAGAVAAFLFTAFHQVIISNIWFSLPIMLIAGAACGASIGWTYGLLFRVPSLLGFLAYNLSYVAMFAIMGGVSVAIFEPITTMAAVIEANESPTELIGEAMPMTIAFTLAAAILITLAFGRRLSTILPVLTTCVVLVVTLGLNVSIIGLVDIPVDSVYLAFELFGLVFAMDIFFVATFLALERGMFLRTAPVA